MSGIPRIGDLELPQDPAFTRREWAVQRCGWAALLLTVAAALVGLLGRGPLSDRIRPFPDGRARVEYHRFLHLRDPDTLRIVARAASAEDGHLRVRLDRAYLDSVEIRRVMPQPVREELDAGGQTFLFAVPDRTGEIAVTFHYEPDAMGSLAGEVHVGGAGAVRIEQFVYP